MIPYCPIPTRFLLLFFCACMICCSRNANNSEPKSNFFTLVALTGRTVTILNVDGYLGFVILPDQADSKKSWVFHTPTILPEIPDNHNIWLFRSFLEHGIAVAGIDVGESYGSPEGSAVYTKFYTHLVNEHGLSSKVNLLACSRGGLQAYNWASRNPQLIKCIAGIYPVSDLRSYPGLDNAAKAYGLSKSALEARLEEFNPISQLEPLARAGIPILHVHGTSDKTVPLESNSRELFNRYRALNGSIKLIEVPGAGHFATNDFYHSRQLLGFILENSR